MNKILVIRFSSIGDVLQTLSVVNGLSEYVQESEIFILTQTHLTPFFENNPSVRGVFSLKKKSGLKELWRSSGLLADQNFTHVYDAHNNLRSRLLVWMLRARFKSFKFIRRPIYRFKRFLLFRFRINWFEQPFSGQRDQLRPLQKWGVKSEIPLRPGLFIPTSVVSHVKSKLFELGLSDLSPSFVALAPSAAYPLKRWPKENFEELIAMSENQKFVLLGGPEDLFLEEIKIKFPERVFNLAGQLSLLESAAAVSLSRVLVSNDTGIMHMAEQLNHPCVALMGPAPFGHPSKPSTKILERDLWCRPCSKHGQGPCVNKEFQKCLRDISALEVKSRISEVRG